MVALPYIAALFETMVWQPPISGNDKLT